MVTAILRRYLRDEENERQQNSHDLLKLWAHVKHYWLLSPREFGCGNERSCKHFNLLLHSTDLSCTHPSLHFIQLCRNLESIKLSLQIFSTNESCIQMSKIRQNMKTPFLETAKKIVKVCLDSRCPFNLTIFLPFWKM